MSEWVVQAPKQAGQVSIGFHVGPFKGIENFKMSDGALKWRFVWEVQSGPEKGNLATSLTDRTIDANKLPGVLIAGLLGRPLVPGENVEEAVKACIGTVYMVEVKVGPKGGKPCVRSVSKPPPM
jgi:hypothetical protein